MKLTDLFESLSEVKAFLQGKSRNTWLRADGFDIYVRKGYHRIGPEVVDCFDIANIEQPDESLRGQGKFRAFVISLRELLESSAELRGSIKCIFVESLLNPQLEASLPSMGFKPVQGSLPPSFYMELDT